MVALSDSVITLVASYCHCDVCVTVNCDRLSGGHECLFSGESVRDRCEDCQVGL